MENYRTRIGPLPGGRRGASGAGAGRDSMRAASRARGAARPPSSPSRPSSPPDGLVSAGSSRTRQAAPAAGGVRRMRWTKHMNINALRAYYRAKGEETGGIAYRARMHRFFAELEPSVPVTEQNLADRVRYIIRSKIFDDAELERLRREAIPSSNEPARAGDAAVQATDQQPHIEGAMDLPALVDSGDDGKVTQELEQMRSKLEEAIVETRSTPLENRPRLPRIPLSKRNRAVVRALNPMLVTYLEASRDLCETDSILFGAALAVCRIVGAKLPTAGRATRQSSAIPAWRRRIEDRIVTARALIGRLISFRSGNNRPRIVRTVRMAFAGTNISLSQPDITQKLTERIDDLKQRIAAWGKRIRRYTERSTRFNQNRLFQSDQKRLYKSLERPMVRGTGQAPNQADTVAFWRGLWSEPVNHREGPWTEAVVSQCANLAPMDPIIITPDDVAEAVRRAPNWKSPGLDGLHHYWLKGFVVCHAVLARQFQEALDQKSLPSLFTTGITHLVPKDRDTIDPSKYRPITCLPTIYKTLTSILSARITRHLNSNQVMSRAQNGCRGGGRGTKEPLLIDAVIGKVVKRNRRNLSAAWIDYKKAFDSVPHTWLERVLELYKVDCTVRDFLGQCMGQWSTILCHLGERMTAAENHIRIRRGIFQGDCLSPIWFCLSLNPLSTLLEGSGRGFQLRRGGTKVTHLFYMDDLKLFASSRSHLMELLNITCDFSNSIRMELGTDKCAVLHVERGRVANSEGIDLSMPINIRTLSEAETYRYLGMSQNIGVDEAGMKQSVCDVFYARLTKVLNSLLSGVNKTHAYNGWVMPVLMYTFGILRWTQTELNALDRKVRTIMTSHRMHHPRSSVMRLYLPRKHGGRGFLSALTMHNREVCSLRNYFLTRADDPYYRDVISCDKGLTPLSLANEQWQDPAVQCISDRETVWKEKELHGRFYKALHEPFVDTVASLHWLRFGDLFGETEGFVCAIQDQVIKTNNYRRYILKDGAVDICRACRHPGESLRHVISGCSALSNSEYLHRHNLVARILHQELALKYGLVDRKLPYYKYLPEAVLENDRARLYWDRAIITDRTILANKPDIVLMDRAQSRIFLVDITIPYDENLVKAETDKVTKYLDLAHEVTGMWGGLPTEIIPVVVSANGLIPVSLPGHLRRLGLRDGPLQAQMQKAVLLDTARIVRRFLSLSP
ncbi:unnamed protein product [Parnassius mnemosyne]|uniref:Reverse transcriptase domain-containing protein n=1 Tax=Parnassius mnemosyne TaxID=213953 RepID=A0AAV1LMG8_9NEOP